jgi:hypothetical protein
MEKPEAPEGYVPALAEGVDAQYENANKRPNPGQFDMRESESRKILNVDVFEGMRFDWQNQLSPKFFMGHNIWMGAPPPPHPGAPPGTPGGPPYTYHFSSTLATDVLQVLGRMGTDGVLDARIYQQVTPNLLARIEAQVSPTFEKGSQHSANALVDYKGEDYCLNFLMGGGMMLGMSYFQSLTNKLAMGGKLTYHGKRKACVIDASAKWTDPTYSFCGSYSMNQLQTQDPRAPLHLATMQYVRKVNSRTGLGSELVYIMNNGELRVNFGGEFNLKQSRFQTNIDQSGRIKSSLETIIAPILKLVLTAEMSHATDEYKFGFGLQYGQ